MTQVADALMAAPAADALRVRGESALDRVSSFLMAVVLGAAVVVGWLALVYATNRAYASRVAAPLEIVEVMGGGGGSPDGTPGSTESVDVPGAVAAAQASNNEEQPADFEEPSVQDVPAAMLDAAAEAGSTLAEVDLGAAMPNGGLLASGKRASKLGSGGPGLGFGPGDGGVPREQRWSIVFDEGQSPEEYARQLDALKVELAVIAGNQLRYASNLSAAKPTTRVGTGRGDDRLYFLWQGRGRKGSDVVLLRKAGLDPGESALFHFYPKGAEAALGQLEVRFKGRQPAEIRSTRFAVVPQGNTYGFQVVAQDALR